MRVAGAIILGKTVTCEFAGISPSVTANPHDPARTPGGSSSGSGAAVADFMVPVAFGTQTGGSVLRPSSYCGIIGYKPTFGTFNRWGIKMAAESLDTIGIHARTLDDVELLSAVLVGRTPSASVLPDAAPRIGLCRTPLWELAQPETVEAVEDAAARLKAAGASVREVTLPDAFAGLSDARETINIHERLQAMAWEWNNHREKISDRLTSTLKKGVEMPYGEYAAAMKLGEACRARLEVVFDGIDALIAPCVTGEAPAGLEFTGDPKFQGLWTILHTPEPDPANPQGPQWPASGDSACRADRRGRSANGCRALGVGEAWSARGVMHDLNS